MADTERKHPELINKVVIENEMKGLIPNCKKREWVGVFKTDSRRRQLRIGEVRIKQVQKFKYHGRVKADDGKCDIKIRSCIGIAINAFPNLSKVYIKRKITLDKNAWLLSNICFPIVNPRQSFHRWSGYLRQLRSLSSRETKHKNNGLSKASFFPWDRFTFTIF